MNGYAFSVSCPACGGPVAEIARGRVIAGSEQSVIVGCVDRCLRHRSEWQLCVFLLPVVETRKAFGEVQGCGTEAGYKRHRRQGETPCEACVDAHTIHGHPDGPRDWGHWYDERIQRRRDLAEIGD